MFVIDQVCYIERLDDAKDESRESKMKGKNSLYRVGSLYRGSLYRALTVYEKVQFLIL